MTHVKEAEKTSENKPMTDILTDEMIEIAARAFALSYDGDEKFWRAFDREIRAALTAALPSIVEACAMVAENWGSSEPGEFNEGADFAIGQAVRAIRSLIPPQSVKQEE